MARLRRELKPNPHELSRWESRQPINKYNIAGPLREYFASGSERLGNNIVATCDKWLRTVVHEDLLLQNSRVTLGVAPHSQAVLLLPALNLTDAALGVRSITLPQRRRFLAHLAFLGYTFSRDDYWSPPRGFAANPNMTTTVAQYQVTVASLIPSHPRAKDWAARGLGELRSQLNGWSDEDGGWREAPHYAMVSYDHMLGAFLMAARAGFGDYVHDDRVRKVAEWLARISTPRDPRTRGFRHLPPIGNTYFGEATGVFGIIAGLWKERDPEFASHMQWMCEEHGSPDLGLGWSFPAMTGYKELLKSRGVAPRRPAWGSSWFRDTGVVLRSAFGSDRETYLHLIAGPNHDHYDYDSGSIIMWGKGRVLADDWGYIGRHGQKFHSMLTSSATPRGGTMRITAFSSQGSFDYVSGKKGAWQRRIGFVKDADPVGPNFILVRDTHDADAEAVWRLWLTAKTVQVHGQGATVVGMDDVDLDIFVHDAGALGLRTESATQRVSVGNRDGRIGPLKNTQTALVATLPGRGAVTVVLYPRLKTEPAPRVRWHADGRIAEVVSESGTDHVFLAATSRRDGPAAPVKVALGRVAFQGAAGAIQARGGREVLTLGAAGEISAGDRTLASDAAATRTWE